MQAGRPSTYTPEIGLKILEKMSEGFSLVAAASFVDVGRTTIYEWLERFPEFKSLYTLAQAKRQAHWEQELLTTGSSARVTAGLKALGGMRSPDWSDDSRLEITGKDGQALFQAITFSVIDARETELKTIEGEVLSEDE